MSAAWRIPGPWLAAALMAAPAADAGAAWHDQFPVPDMPVHYVHLSGHGGDNRLLRQQTEEAYQACVDINQKLGRPVQPLPAAGIPALIQSHDIEIYYAKRRTLTVRRGSLYSIDGGNCALVKHEHALLDIAGDRGKCTVDLLKRQMRGPCDFPPLPGKRGTGRHLFAGSGEFRNLAGQRCEIYRYGPDGAEKCVARPASGFPIPAALLHLGMPGLLLELVSPALTLRAQEALLDLRVSRRIFDIPQDIDRSGERR